MADIGGGPYRTGDVVKRLGSSSGTSVHHDSLIKKRLIFSPDFGLVDFTAPQIAAFMRRRRDPIERLRDPGDATAISEQLGWCKDSHS